MISLRTTWILRGVLTIGCTLFCSAFLDFLQGPGFAHSADWAVNPFIKLSEKYDSNIRMQARNPEEDAISYITPGMNLAGEAEDRRLSFDTIIPIQKYVMKDEWDTIETDTKLYVMRKWSERFTADAQAQFKKDSTLDTELSQAGLRTVRTERFQYRLDLSADYRLSERWSLNAAAGGGYSDYEDDLLPDSNSSQGSFGASWDLTPQDTVGLLEGYTYTDYLDSSTISNLAQTIFWKRALSETATLELSSGYRFTWIDYFVQRPVIQGNRISIRKIRQEATDDGLLFNLSLTKYWSDQLSTTFVAGRDEYNSADARAFERNYVRVTARYGLSERTTLHCGFNYYLNTQTARGDEEVNYFRIAPAVDYKITKDLSIRVAGSYERLLRDVSFADSTADRFQAWVELTWWLPRLWANQ